MAANFKLTIVTPMGQIRDDDVDMLTAPGSEGQFGVLANHAPMIVAVQRGVLKVVDEDGDRYYTIGGGLVEIARGGDVLVLVDACEEADSADDAKAKLKEAAL